MMETDEDTSNKLHGTYQRTEHKGHLWCREETQFLLNMYEKNAHNVGPDKEFRSKLHLWNDISRRLNKAFQLQRTTVQCIGRFKALQRKNFKDSSNFNNTNNRKTKSTAALNKMSSSDDDVELGEAPDTDTEPFAIADVIRSTLLEIYELKEEAKERRHRERMKLLETFLHQEKANIEKVPAAALDTIKIKDENVDAPSSVLGAQQPSENDNQAMRARLLEMQRKKMEDRERKHRVSMTPKQQRLSVRDFK